MARTSDDPVKRAAALSYHRGRSGDIIVVPERNWLLSSAATTHGTLYPYDQRVPVIFFGAGVRAAAYDTPATPADIAPTLAELAGVRFERTEAGLTVRTPEFTALLGDPAGDAAGEPELTLTPPAPGASAPRTPPR